MDARTEAKLREAARAVRAAKLASRKAERAIYELLDEQAEPMEAEPDEQPVSPRS